MSKSSIIAVIATVALVFEGAVWYMHSHASAPASGTSAAVPGAAKAGSASTSGAPSNAAAPFAAQPASSSALPPTASNTSAPAGEVVMNPALARKQQLEAEAAARAKAERDATLPGAKVTDPLEAKRLAEAKRVAAAQAVQPDPDQTYAARYAGMSKEDLAAQLAYFRDLYAQNRGRVQGKTPTLTEEQLRSMEFEIAWLQTHSAP